MSTSFAVWDYAIFFIYLLATVFIGVWFSRGQSSLDEYFLAGRNMNRFVIAMTILASLFSGISYLAAPSEVYTNGFAFAWIVMSFFIATPFTAIWLMPHFYNSRYITVYHYLEDRFGLSLRLFSSGLFILRVTLWLAAATYAPALALREVTGLPLGFTIVITGLVTTVYTVLGGMKAVIWTDVMQLFVLFGGQLLITFVAAAKVDGGFAGIWDICVANDRLDLSFSRDPSVRVTFWGVIIGGAFLSLVQMATDQVSVQRYLSAGSMREAQRALWIKLLMTLPVLVLFYGTGLVLYAFYQQYGDPIAAGHIAKGDQILPYFVITQLPAGLPGLLIAAIFAASMSTVSAGVNSLTSATLCDFYQRLTPPERVNEKRLVTLARWLTLGYGVFVTIAAFGIGQMKSNLVESVNTIIALVGGPLLGLFLLGVFTKRADTRGATIGCVVGFAMLLVIYANNVVSFLWLTMIGCLITMGFGWIASTGASRETSKA